jgi:hypothetical protein
LTTIYLAIIRLSEMELSVSSDLKWTGPPQTAWTGKNIRFFQLAGICKNPSIIKEMMGHSYEPTDIYFKPSNAFFLPHLLTVTIIEEK